MIDEFSWAVGFWEGEGTIVNPNKGKGLSVSAAQKDLEPLIRLRDAFGCGKVLGPYNEGRIFRWVVSGNDARNVMARILPYLSARRQEQVQAALDKDVAWDTKNFH